MEGKGYRTRQREAILHYLQNSDSCHVSVEEVSDHLKASGEKVGRTTVYRYMEKLAAEGVLRKYFIEEGAGACYQYVEPWETCREHFHLKCLRCGTLLHLECEFLDQIGEHIRVNHGFEVDNTKTVFYGICKDCKEKVLDVSKKCAKLDRNNL